MESLHKNKVYNALEVINWFLLFFTVIVIPFWLLSEGFYLSLSTKERSTGDYFILNTRKSWVNIVLITIGVFLIILRIYLVKRREDNWGAIKSQIKNFTVHAKTPWSIGGGLACIFTGVFFLIPSENENILIDRLDSTVGISLSLVALTLGAHFLYKNMGPIIRTEKMLEYLIKDLNAIPKHADIWFVYPALNIGFYRALLNNDNPWSVFDGQAEFNKYHLTGKFFEALRGAIEDKHPKAFAITYPKESLTDLYLEYDRMLRTNIKNDNERREVVKYCKDSAEKLLALFKKDGAANISNVELFPSSFPQHLIIIDDVVYFISSYGLPVLFKCDDGKYTFEKIEKDHVADLVTWRRKDASLAKSIIPHLKNVKENSPEIDKQSWLHENWLCEKKS